MHVSNKHDFGCDKDDSQIPDANDAKQEAYSSVAIERLYHHLLDHHDFEKEPTLRERLQAAIHEPELLIKVLSDPHFRKIIASAENTQRLIDKAHIRIIEAQRIIERREKLLNSGNLSAQKEDESKIFCLERRKALREGCEQTAEILLELFYLDQDIQTRIQQISHTIAIDLDRTLIKAEQEPDEKAVTQRLSRTMLQAVVENGATVERPVEMDNFGEESGDALDALFGGEEVEGGHNAEEAVDSEEEKTKAAKEELKEKMLDYVLIGSIPVSILVIALSVFKKLFED